MLMIADGKGRKRTARTIGRVEAVLPGGACPAQRGQPVAAARELSSGIAWHRRGLTINATLHAPREHLQSARWAANP
jgi:hypothetical protein